MKTKLLKGHQGQALHDFGTESGGIPTVEHVGRSVAVVPSLHIKVLPLDPV